MSRRGVTLIVGVVLLVTLGALIYWTPAPEYVELVPGPTYNTLGSNNGKQLITITGGPVQQPTGQLRMLTVGEIEDIKTYQVITGWVSGNSAVVPREII